MNRAACTIVSPNYLAYARTLSASYLAQHPGHRFFVLIVADLDDAKPFVIDDFIPIMLPKIGIPNLRAEAMKYEILELNTNVKPSFLKFLLNTYKLDQLTYLDPDIFCYAPLTPVFEALDAGASAVLTPHLTTPVFDGRSPSEQDQLFNGTFNLGFIAVNSTPESLNLLDWWERRCLDLGFSEGRTGLFVDQKWMNLAPGFFPGVAILRHPGCNMAYWNLHERSLQPIGNGYLVESATTAQPVPLCFFHFSGIDVNDPDVLSKNTNRFTLADRPDLHTLIAHYKATVNANHHASESLPYGFDRFSDGTTLNRLARRLYAAHQQHFLNDDPFAAGSRFAAFAKRLGVVKGSATPAKATWREFNPR
ncbi:MAG: group 1 glycosyl transferase, partial [Acidobacteriota bacterium]